MKVKCVTEGSDEAEEEEQGRVPCLKAPGSPFAPSIVHTKAGKPESETYV